MTARVMGWALVAAVSLSAAIIEDLRAAIARNDFQAARKLIADYRTARGVTPEMPEALSWLGPKPPAQAEWKGRVVLLFFWAHWCRDCKEQVPALARLRAECGGRGLLLIGPTQRYGYVARGQEAGPDEGRTYIEQVRRKPCGVLGEIPFPLSAENFKVYGASTTPTLVLVDRQGLVRLYHPGEMSYDELAPKVAELLGATTH